MLDYTELMAHPDELGFPVRIDDLPSELPEPIPFRDIACTPAAIGRRCNASRVC